MDKFKNEFQCWKFGFKHARAEDFYVSAWSDSRFRYLVYKTISFAIAFGWLFAFWLNMTNNEHYLLLTNWTELYVVAYYLSSTLMALYGVYSHYNKPGNKIPMCVNILMCTCWILQTVSFAHLFCVVLLYWPFVSDLGAQFHLGAFDIYKHGVILILFLLDVFVSSIPVQILHFIYINITYCFYIAVLVARYCTEGRPFYRIMDFKNGPIVASIVIMVLMLGSILSQISLFLLRLTRNGIAKRTRNKENIFIKGKPASDMLEM